MQQDFVWSSLIHQEHSDLDRGAKKARHENDEEIPFYERIFIW